MCLYITQVPFCEEKVFNYSELHFSKVTSYKIHILVDYLGCISVHFYQSYQSYLQVNHPRIYGVNYNSLYFRLD